MTQKGTATELGNQPIGKLLTQYAIPAIIAMTASSLYNMVDSIFIGHGVGAMAISGLAITFPLMNLAAAFGSLVGVGASTLVSVKLGQKDYSTAQQILGNVVSLNLIIGILFTILTLAFLDPILYFFGASEVTLPYARDYMVTILLGNVVTHVSGTKLRTAFCRPSAKGNGSNHTDRRHQYPIRPFVHLRIRYGNTWSSYSNHSGTDYIFMLAN